MEFIISDFILDTDRLIIYPATLSKEDKELICTCVTANDNYDELCGRLSRLDADHMNAEKCLPPTAGICLTYRCQLNCNYCSFCSRESGTELELGDVIVFINFLLKRHLVRQIAAKQKSEFILYFTGGGEPTKNWKLFQSTVDYIREKCISNNIRYQLHLTTNGMLSESQVQYIYKNFSTIMVSYDGISEIQDHNRRISGGGKSSPVVERTITMLDALDAAYTIRTTIWQSDFNRLCDMADHIYTSFPRNKGWSISPILVTGRAIENMEDAYLDGDKYNFIDNFVKAADYALSRYGARSMSIKLFPNSRTDIFCGSCYVLNPWLMPDGSISTCLEAKEGIPVIGSVKGGRVVMYPEYTDELLKEYRRRFLSDSCRHCIAFRFCRVGCPLKFVEDNYSGRHAAAWVCDMTKYYWRYIIQQISKGNRVFGWYAKRFSDARLQHIPVYEMKDSARED